MANFDWYCYIRNGCSVFTVLFQNGSSVFTVLFQTRIILDSAKICDKSLQFWSRASHSKFPSFKSWKQNIYESIPFVRCFIHLMTVLVDNPERNQNLSIVTNTHRKETMMLRNSTNTFVRLQWNNRNIYRAISFYQIIITPCGQI